jgi:hypothetical protein
VGLWLPPSAQPLVDERHAVDAERAQLADDHMHRLLEDVRRINAELRRIDSHLELVFVGDRAPDLLPEVRPGRWHVVRRNPGAPDTWMPVVGPAGEYVEPTSRIFERLAQGDMWRDEYGHRARRRQAHAAAERERRRDLDREQRATELRERVAAATQVRISFNPDERWSQNVAGRRGRRPA